MKKWINNLTGLIVACVVTVILLCSLNELLIKKEYNRYYIMDKNLEMLNETYDVQIYGSCHAYTSFDPMHLIECYRISCYNMSNPGEIIPATYLRMYERFKKNAPKVALIETWGLNAYETYILKKDVFGNYLDLNIGGIPLSWEKIQVIQDFEELDLITETFAALKYKDRLLDMSLSDVDVKYSYELYKQTFPDAYEWFYEEMDARFENNGFLPYPSTPLNDYAQQQGMADPGEILEVEADLMKYIEKIIKLCDDYDVELIFYRAPYRATDNEWRKVNYLKKYFEERNILFVDLETEISFDYVTDFRDYEHLSEVGAAKSTAFLADYVLDAMELNISNGANCGEEPSENN